MSKLVVIVAPFSKNLYSEPGPKVEMGTECQMVILGKVCKYAHLLQLYNNSSSPSHQMIFRISKWELKMCLTFQM